MYCRPSLSLFLVLQGSSTQGRLSSKIVPLYLPTIKGVVCSPSWYNHRRLCCRQFVRKLRTPSRLVSTHGSCGETKWVITWLEVLCSAARTLVLIFFFIMLWNMWSVTPWLENWFNGSPRPHVVPLVLQIQCSRVYWLQARKLHCNVRDVIGGPDHGAWLVRRDHIFACLPLWRIASECHEVLFLSIKYQGAIICFWSRRVQL